MSHEGRELHEIVSNYGFPVFVSDEFDTIITWNGINTFLFWAPLAEDARTGEWIAGGYRRPKKWSNTDVCTINAVGNVRNAESLAKIWHKNLLVSTDDE